MINPLNYNDEPLEALNPLAEELLEVILQEEECYPWNPAEPEAEAYFKELEADFSLLDGFNSEEIASQAESLFSHLHKYWSSVSTTQVRESLAQKFGHLIPVSPLETIIKQAENILEENLDPLSQLIECVKPLWLNWTEEDFQVLARPFVYAMEQNYPIRQAEWDELSEIEQIRLTLAIAQEALAELQAKNSNKIE
jgi:hypothetical protein